MKSRFSVKNEKLSGKHFFSVGAEDEIIFHVSVSAQILVSPRPLFIDFLLVKQNLKPPTLLSVTFCFIYYIKTTNNFNYHKHVSNTKNSHIIQLTNLESSMKQEGPFRARIFSLHFSSNIKGLEEHCLIATL